MANLLKKFKIDFKYRFKIFRTLYLKRFSIISAIIIYSGYASYQQDGNLISWVVLCSICVIGLFFLFMIADIHSTTNGGVPNNPVKKMLVKAKDNDEEYQSILEDEEKELARKNEVRN